MTLRLASIIGGICIAGALSTARGEMTQGAPTDGAVAESIRSLSADDFKTREQATAQLQLIIAGDLRAAIAPGKAAAAAESAEFSAAVARWALETLTLPPADRKAAVEFGARAEVLPLIGQAFSRKASERVLAARSIARFDGRWASWMLSELIDDTNRSVYVAAMEAAGDRSPTPELVEALWKRSMTLSFRHTPAAFGDEPQPDYNAWSQHAPKDAEAACNILIKYKSPLVAARLGMHLRKIEQQVQTAAPGTYNPGYLVGGVSTLKNFSEVLAAYKPKDAYVILNRLCNGPQGQVITVPGANGFYQTGRTHFIGELLRLIGEKPQDYGLKTGRYGNGTWTFDKQDSEERALKKINDWWAAHGKDYQETPATVPASKAESGQ